ncbi:flagellar basal body-associated FliL family protein [Couchioplanes caeruleus]|uniref:Uncharacterized protein n=2 Tax=Couchioplanes caeruleus TaxID=56438 RepID=A0A1K0FK69_9ACTN|nr:hypothetical protein [Couchioplanes caeruleus]OJF13217.1 hypothetical protein BG844_16540 [Couchioplanes caeruleus subsp. caeruleus]ROP27782.1 hypothetical protein EDD30_0477 [Couchioplanes caeruleus]
MAVPSSTPNKKRPLLVAGLIAVVLMVGAVVAGAYLWRRYQAPSQASAADCALAQSIIDRARQVPRDKAAAEKWAAETRQMRITGMKDGYLGALVAQYEGWAVASATGEGRPPAPREVTDLRDEANGHCEEAGRTLTFPPIVSALRTVAGSR